MSTDTSTARRDDAADRPSAPAARPAPSPRPFTAAREQAEASRTQTFALDLTAYTNTRMERF